MVSPFLGGASGWTPVRSHPETVSAEVHTSARDGKLRVTSARDGKRSLLDCFEKLVIVYYDHFLPKIVDLKGNAHKICDTLVLNRRDSNQHFLSGISIDYHINNKNVACSSFVIKKTDHFDLSFYKHKTSFFHCSPPLFSALTSPNCSHTKQVKSQNRLKHRASREPKQSSFQ